MENKELYIRSSAEEFLIFEQQKEKKELKLDLKMEIYG